MEKVKKRRGRPKGAKNKKTDDSDKKRIDRLEDMLGQILNKLSQPTVSSNAETPEIVKPKPEPVKFNLASHNQEIFDEQYKVKVEAKELPNVTVVVKPPIALNGRWYAGRCTVRQDIAGTLRRMMQDAKVARQRVSMYIEHPDIDLNKSRRPTGDL